METNTQQVLIALNQARTRNGRSPVSLSHEGGQVWNETVVPAIETALPRAADSAFMFPYFDHLTSAHQAGITNKTAYDEGVYIACRDEGRGVASNLVLAKQFLSDFFFCERLRLLQGEPANERGLVDSGILRQRLEETLRDNNTPLEALPDFQAGVAAGAVKLVLNSLTTSRCHLQPVH